MTKKGLLGGGKFSGRHTSLIDEAEFLVRAAKKMPDVKKISIGVIIPARVGRRRLKLVPSEAGLLVTVRGVHAAQRLFIFTDRAVFVKESVERAWHDIF